MQQEHDTLFGAFDLSLVSSSLPLAIRQRVSSAHSHSRSMVHSTTEQEQEPPPKLIFSVLPYWKKWQLEVSFNRTILEEFMDRYVYIQLGPLFKRIFLIRINYDQLFIYTYIHVRSHTHTHAHTHTYYHKHTHIHMPIRTHICTQHTHTHTDKHTRTTTTRMLLNVIVIHCILISSRNISMLESFSSVLLAVLVCVVAGLLLNIGFYKNFWVFNLCWVVGTAHFSLIKVC